MPLSTRCAIAAWLIAAMAHPSIRAQQDEAVPPGPAVPVPEGDEAPTPLVPANPRSVADRDRIDAVRDYAAARAKERRRAWREAISLLESARMKDPKSAEVIRRLGRVQLALGRLNQAIALSRESLQLDPNDLTTLQLVVAYHQRGNDAAEVEKVLREVLQNPALRANSGAALLARRDLALLLAGREGKLPQALGLLERVVKGLDQPGAEAPSARDLAAILGNDPGRAYEQFGRIFLLGNRPELAELAFRRGLSYLTDDPTLGMGLVDALRLRSANGEALAVLEPILERTPRDLAPYRALGELLEALGRREEALARLEKLAAADPKNFAAKAALADRYSKAGVPEKARALLDELAAVPADAATAALLADLLIKERRVDDLLRVLAQAVRRPQGPLLIGPVLTRLGGPEAAFGQQVVAAALVGLSAEPPTLPEELIPLIVQVANRLDQDAVALDLARLAVRRKPTQESYLELMFALSEAAKHAEAARTLEAMFEKFPETKDARTLLTLAEVRQKAGEAEGAIAAIREAREADKGNNLEVNRYGAYLLGELGQIDEAIAIAREVIERAPNELRNVVTLYLLLLKAGRLEQALEATRAALARDEANPELMLLVGEALDRLGRVDEAIAHYQDIERRFAANDEVLLKVGQRLSATHVKAEQFRLGEEVLEKLLERFPDDAGLNNDLGYLYADQGKELARAERMIRKAVDEDPENSSFLDSLGWVLYKLGRVGEAVTFLEKAVKNTQGGEGRCTLLDHLGDAYFANKDFAKAKDAWTRAVDAGNKETPPDRRVQDIRKKFELLDRAGSAPNDPSREISP